MQNIRTKRQILEIKAFTLVESLLTLFVVSFVTLLFYSGVGEGFHQAQEQLFFQDFEALYRESQDRALHSHQEVVLQINETSITNGRQTSIYPQGVRPAQSYRIVFAPGTGGNSSLQKVVFQSRNGFVEYQLYIGSGRYQKKNR
ncbi:Late competence protein ComGD, access of DNA to ComEA [Streptococcus sp. DD13]|nr:Late competence protein ComGD, access of DNA to ComEA [Streptococcus sp. DD13]